MTTRQGGLAGRFRVEYKKLRPYRYMALSDAAIPIISPRLRGALYSSPTIDHPYFTITPHAVIAKSTYAWDGVTFSPIQPKKLIVPSLTHDIGCQAVNMGLLPHRFRALFDKEYYLQSKRYGVSEITAQIHYALITFWGLIPKHESLKPRYARSYFIETGDP